MKYFNKLKEKWGIHSNLDFLLIMVVFSVAGSSVLYVADFISDQLGVNEQTSLSMRILVRILLIFPIYQLLLLIYGFIFGQFRFFWEKEKKMGQWLLQLFTSK